MIDRSLLNSLCSSTLLTQQAMYAHNQLNIAKNGLGMKKTLRNHMSHMIKSYVYASDIYGGHL